ncbi:hypothetical protein OSCI_2120003 [Kamptonema sp. PCC 6506]|nr:hypothetical protein OSCI_2120003 [Kamptonema sp. PCC 6506]
MVERRSPKPDVGGSSPPGRAESPTFKVLPESAEIYGYIQPKSPTFG